MKWRATTTLHLCLWGVARCWLVCCMLLVETRRIVIERRMDRRVGFRTNGTYRGLWVRSTTTRAMTGEVSSCCLVKTLLDHFLDVDRCCIHLTVTVWSNDGDWFHWSYWDNWLWFSIISHYLMYWLLSIWWGEIIVRAASSNWRTIPTAVISYFITLNYISCGSYNVNSRTSRYLLLNLFLLFRLLRSSAIMLSLLFLLFYFLSQLDFMLFKDLFDSCLTWDSRNLFASCSSIPKCWSRGMICLLLLILNIMLIVTIGHMCDQGTSAR